MPGLRFILNRATLDWAFKTFQVWPPEYEPSSILDWLPEYEPAPIKDWLPRPFRSTKTAQPSKFLRKLMAKAGV